MKSRKILLSLLVTLLFAGVWAQVPNLRNFPLPQDPELLAGRLENGLSYYIKRNAKPENIAEMRLYVDVGSVNEDDDQCGLAHFTEHMAFNGTKNFAKTEVVNYLSSIGMGYYNGLNGMTSYDFTVYTFKIPTDDAEKLNKGLLILSDMAHQVSFEGAEIESERGVIIEEWRMGQDAGTRIRDAQNEVFLAGSRYAERSPIGTYEVISSFEHDTIKRFYHDWYRPDLQSVVIVGDFDPQEMLELVEDYFGSIPARENARPREDFSVPANPEPLAVVATDPEYAQNVIQVMWKKPVTEYKSYHDLREEMKSHLFYTMFNARLSEHSKKPEPPYSFAMAFEYSMLRTMSTAAVYALFSPGEAENALQTILTEAERVQRFGFLPTEFERAKAELMRDLEQAVAQKDTQESDSVAWELIDAIANQKVVMSAEDQESRIEFLLPTVSLEEVNAVVASLIQDENLFIAIGAPEKAGLSYPSQERLLEIARNVSSQEIEAYEDKTVNEPIMEAIPEAVAIKSEEYDAETGINTWVLANGVKVYAKKTNFKNDEVLLSATSPGGYTRYPESDLPSAMVLAQYVSESGFGKFDSVNLNKATSGKLARAGIKLGAYSEGLSGSCSPKDMELMFQMLFQYATNARFDAQDFASFIRRTKNSNENLMLEPMQVFINRLFKEVQDNHPYSVDLASVDLDTASLETVQRIYRDRFSDFSDFSFVIVGNYDEASLKQFCQIYLGNLPTGGRMESLVDVGMRNFKGQKEVVLRKGSDRAFAAHFKSGAYLHSVQNEVDMEALELILNDKLRENIREERSGVYMIQAMSQASEIPVPGYFLGTFMACSPQRVDELSEAIFATLDSLRTGHLEERYIVTARETLKQQYLESVKSNRYWLRNIEENIRLSRPLTEFLQRPESFELINLERMISTARLYLDFEPNKLSVTMLPEKTEEAP